MDILVQMYDATDGTLLWSTIFDGGSVRELPVDITVSNFGVFVTGNLATANNDYNIFTANLSATTGATNWIQQYDFAGFNDLSVELRSTNFGVEVLGSSSVNNTSWEAAVLSYNSLGFAGPVKRSGLSVPPNFIAGDPAKLPFWIRSSIANLWFSPEVDGGAYVFSPDNHIFFESVPQFNGNILQGTISGYAIVIGSAFGLNDPINITCDGDCEKVATPENPININECYLGEPSFTFSFLAKDPQTEVDEIVITDIAKLPAKASQLIAFPNPTTGSITVEVTPSISEEGTLRILNVQGKMLQQKNIQLQSGLPQQFKFDLSTYPRGIYFVNLTTAHSVSTIKFVKQ